MAAHGHRRPSSTDEDIGVGTARPKQVDVEQQLRDEIAGSAVSPPEARVSGTPRIIGSRTGRSRRRYRPSSSDRPASCGREVALHTWGMVTTPARQPPETAAPPVRRALRTRPGLGVTRPSAGRSQQRIRQRPPDGDGRSEPLTSRMARRRTKVNPSDATGGRGVAGPDPLSPTAGNRRSGGVPETSGTPPDRFLRRFDPRSDHHQVTLRSCTFAVLVRSVLLGIEHGARAMQAAGRGGAIVNTPSVAAFSGGAGPQAYSAAEAAVLDLGRDPACRHQPGTGRLLRWRSR